MSIITGPGVGTLDPNALSRDVTPADLQAVAIRALPGQGSNTLEFYGPGGALVALMDVVGNLRVAMVTGLNGAFNTGLQTVAMAADANQTLTLPQAQSGIIQMVGGATLTATRNIVLPTVAGAMYTVFNGTTGAQSLQFIGATGTGVTVANGKRADIYCDGTNYVRVTPDT